MPKQKMHIIDMSYFGDFAFKSAADASRFANLLAKALPVQKDWDRGHKPYYHLTGDDGQVEFCIRLNKPVEAQARPKVEIVKDKPKLGLPAPRKGLPAPRKGLPAPE